MSRALSQKSASPPTALHVPTHNGGGSGMTDARTGGAEAEAEAEASLDARARLHKRSGSDGYRSRTYDKTPNSGHRTSGGRFPGLTPGGFHVTPGSGKQRFRALEPMEMSQAHAPLDESEGSKARDPRDVYGREHDGNNSSSLGRGARTMYRLLDSCLGAVLSRLGGRARTAQAVQVRFIGTGGSAPVPRDETSDRHDERESPPDSERARTSAPSEGSSSGGGSGGGSDGSGGSCGDGGGGGGEPAAASVAPRGGSLHGGSSQGDARMATEVIGIESIIVCDDDDASASAPAMVARPHGSGRVGGANRSTEHALGLLNPLD